MKKIRLKIRLTSILERIGQLLKALIFNLRDYQSGPRYWRRVIEEIGGGFIKLAQILALRYEILPPEYCREFAELFDRAKPLSPETIRNIFREEWHKNPEEIFQEFSYEPHASASFGQVHVGVLNNRKVAVKLQRPDILLLVRIDIIIIRFLARVFKFFLGLPATLEDALSEWENWTFRELDYLIEGRNIERLRLTNSSPDVYIPELFKELSTSRILVTEFLEGLNLNEVINRKVVELSFETKQRVVRQIVWAQLTHYFRDGFFQADPHPGNIILLSDGRLGYVDLGIVGESGSPQQNYNFANFIRFSAEEEVGKAVHHFKESMRSEIFQPDVVESLDSKYKWRNKSAQKVLKGINRFLENKLGGVIKGWAQEVSNQHNSLYRRSTARHFISLILLARRFDINVPANLFAFLRAVVIADMVCLILNPEFNMKEELRRFFEANSDICGDSISALASQVPADSKLPINPLGISRIKRQESETGREGRQRLIERHLEQFGRIMEKILEDGSAALAYFATTVLL